MTCPFLEYRREGDDRSFAVERAYCTAASRFVQPMRADICNDRYDLEHAVHCEIYRAHAGDGGEEGSGVGDEGEGESADGEPRTTEGETDG